MALILSIETGTDICSVALANDGELMALRESDEGRDHAKKVALFVDELLRETGVQPSDLDAIAVGKGPGSYTGLRIGVSFAKGMCYALNIPLISVGSLDALSEVAREDFDAGILDIEDEEWAAARLCPMVDARRMEVYAQIFDNECKSLSEVVAEVVTEQSFKKWREAGKLVIFGNGAKKCAEVLPDAICVDVSPSARGIVRLAEQAFNDGKFEDLAYFEPFYLKEFLVIPSKKKLL
jgi:tRNA threonylcarbamoyladenosine biosynthesis protein TsaB